MLARRCRFWTFAWNYLLHVVLHFDGSLRPPRDPGFPTLPLSLATCAATIHVLSGNNDVSGNDALLLSHASSSSAATSMKPWKLWGMGAKVLKFDPGITTSAHVEYEGLLLGLKWIWQQQQQQQQQHHGLVSTSGSPFNNITTLIIRGYCKSVMDQLHNPLNNSKHNVPKSHSRVLQAHYHQAMTLLRQLLESSSSSSPQAGSYPPKLIVEHIPRAANTLSHNLCEHVMEFVEKEAYNEVVQDILAFKRSSEDNNNVALIEPALLYDRNLLVVPLAKTKRKRADFLPTSSSVLLQILQKHHLVRSSTSSSSSSSTPLHFCRIRYSLRPRLYRYLAQVARESNDDQVLDLIGQALEEQSRIVSSSTTPLFPASPDDNDNDNKQHWLELLEEGIQYQMDAITIRLAQSSLLSSNNNNTQHYKQLQRQVLVLTQKQSKCDHQRRRKRQRQNLITGGRDDYFPRHRFNNNVGEGGATKTSECIPKWFASPPTSTTSRARIGTPAYRSTTTNTSRRLQLVAPLQQDEHLGGGVNNILYNHNNNSYNKEEEEEEEAILSTWRALLQSMISTTTKNATNPFHHQQQNQQRHDLQSNGLWWCQNDDNNDDS